MADIILMSDPKVYAVPIAECGETLVDVRDHTPLLHDPRRACGSCSSRAIGHRLARRPLRTA
jgi:hypothetical protein